VVTVEKPTSFVEAFPSSDGNHKEDIAPGHLNDFHGCGSFHRPLPPAVPTKNPEFPLKEGNFATRGSSLRLPSRRDCHDLRLRLPEFSVL